MVAKCQSGYCLAFFFIPGRDYSCWWRYKYKDKLIAANTEFTTFVLNTYGGFHSLTTPIINRLAHSWAARYHCSFGIAKDQIITKLSMCLRKNLAQQIFHRFPVQLSLKVSDAPATINDVYGVG